MKVAAVQFRPEFGNKPENLRRLGLLVVEAAQAGANLIVLPELCTTGYSFMSAAQAAPQAEKVEGGPTLTFFRGLAARLNTHIVWGMMERAPGGSDLFNSQVYVAPDGSWVVTQKINPWGNDYLWAKPGRSNPPVIEMRLSVKKPGDPPSPMDKFATYKLGMLICRDIRDKKDDKWTDFYEKGDADVVAFSANWGNGGFPATSWMDFAKDNDSILIVSNRYGEEVHNDFGHGGVCVIWPDGRVSCDGLLWDQDCIVYAEV